MEDFKITHTCFICGRNYQFGPNRYDGKYLDAYSMNVCLNCFSANHDGWSPVYEGKILEHLARESLPSPERNQKGLLPVK